MSLKIIFILALLNSVLVMGMNDGKDAIKKLTILKKKVFLHKNWHLEVQPLDIILQNLQTDLEHEIKVSKQKQIEGKKREIIKEQKEKYMIYLRPTDRPAAGRPTDRPADQPTDRPTGQPADRPTDRPTGPAD